MGILKALMVLVSRLVGIVTKFHVWDIQEGEPAEWYERFLIYKLLGSSRSLNAAYSEFRIRNGQEKAKSSPPGWRNQAKSWNWEKRANAWDNRQNEQTEKRWEKTNSEWESRKQEQRHQEWALSRALMSKAEAMLQYPLTQQILLYEDMDDQAMRDLERSIGPQSGEVRDCVRNGGVAIVMPMKWGLRDASLFLETASKLAGMATGGQKMAELEALQTLIEAGWIPAHVLEVAQGKMGEMKDAVRSAFEGVGEG